MLRMRQPNLSIVVKMRLLRSVLLLIAVLACDDGDKDGGNSAGGTLPPVFSAGPANTTNWDLNAGPLLLVSAGNLADTIAVVLPLISDSTIASVQGTSALVSGAAFDLFGRSGNVESTKSVTALPPDSTTECYAWPPALVRTRNSGWRV